MPFVKPPGKVNEKYVRAEIKISKDDDTGTELGWYVTFQADPAASDQYLFVCMVEDVKGRGGSHYVTPVGRSIFTN